jgi:hypothetical protein
MPGLAGAPEDKAGTSRRGSDGDEVALWKSDGPVDLWLIGR